MVTIKHFRSLVCSNQVLHTLPSSWTLYQYPQEVTHGAMRLSDVKIISPACIYFHANLHAFFETVIIKYVTLLGMNAVQFIYLALKYFATCTLQQCLKFSACNSSLLLRNGKVKLIHYFEYEAFFPKMQQ